MQSVSVRTNSRKRNFQSFWLSISGLKNWRVFFTFQLVFAALFAVATAQYGQYAAPEIVRIEPSSYEIRSDAYAAPLVRSSYDSYAAPVVRVEPSAYEIRSDAYAAPLVRSSYDSYATPLVRVAVPIVKYLMNSDNYGSYTME